MKAILKSGDTRTIIAHTAAEGYEFDYWDGDTELLEDTSANPATIIMPEADVSLTAMFRLIPPIEDELVLTFDDIANVPVTDASSVSDWNAFFDLPTNGTPFTTVVVEGNSVNLVGGSEITMKNSLFGNSGQGNSLLKVEDIALCIRHLLYDVFGDDNGEGCWNLTDVSLPNVLSIGSLCFPCTLR